jgi:hypothetical protein
VAEEASREPRQELGAEGMSFEELEASYEIDSLESTYKELLSADQMRALLEEHTSDTAVDEVAYRKALVADLLAAQSVDNAQMQALGPARAEAIRAFFVEQGGLDAGRFSVDPETSTTSDGERWVRSQLVAEAS